MCARQIGSCRNSQLLTPDKRLFESCGVIMASRSVSLKESVMSRINFRAAMNAQPKAFPHPTPAVFVVTDDDEVRECLEGCANPADWQAHAFADAKTFLSHSQMPGPACLVLDLDLPDADGLDVQALVRDRRDMPVIFIARCPSVRTTVRAIKAGAVEFLAKPLDAEASTGCCPASHAPKPRGAGA